MSSLPIIEPNPSQTVQYHPSLEFAKDLDEQDPLGGYREQYHLPLQVHGEPMIYFCGNSLGLEPRAAKAAVLQELEDWAKLGVEGHFEARDPWYSYHELLSKPAAHVVGAKPSEVVVMNTLTTNLHLLMVSFYRPTATRYKILIEDGAFPSDIYAVRSQAAFHGFDPDEAVIAMKPRDGESTLRPEDIETKIMAHGEELALILFGGVNYYTGQAFDMRRIVRWGHDAGAVVGFDLAHAAGNLVLHLHDWDVDFAAWCSYKYLNSGPGGVAGCFVHERHGFDPSLPRFAGWWGTDPQTRFEMRPAFMPQHGAAGWQLSNAQILPMAVHRVALDLFEQAGMPALRTKSDLLTGYLEFLLRGVPGDPFEIITPRNPLERGCQLSIRIGQDARKMSEYLKWEGIIVDYRHPDVIRVAPVPMYNSFEDVWRFVQKLTRAEL
jgi:kynureninase